MDSETVTYLVEYRYLLLVPLAFVESHFLSLAVGFLSRLGHFDPVAAGALIIVANLLGDIALYWLGLHRGEKVVRGWGKYVGITEHSVDRIGRIFRGHAPSILFFSKITNGLGLAVAVLFTAGMARIPFRTYLLWNLLGECVWTGMLVGAGYALGNLYATVGSIAGRIGLAMTGLASFVLLIAACRQFARRVKT